MSDHSEQQHGSGMRNFAAVMLASMLFASTISGGNAFGAEHDGLTPGRPAGIAEAQAKGNETLYVVALGVILVAGVTYLISTDHSQTSVTNFPASSNAIVTVNTTVTTTTTTTTQ